MARDCSGVIDDMLRRAASDEHRMVSEAELAELVALTETMANAVIENPLRAALQAEKLQPLVCPPGPPLDQLRWWLNELCTARSYWIGRATGADDALEKFREADRGKRGEHG